MTSQTLHFCTLFDSRYASRGMAMLESLGACCAVPHDVTILAMDDESTAMLAAMRGRNWRVLRVRDLDDPAFIELEAVRPRREFCWTAAPVLCRSLVAEAAEGDIVTYVDADLLFFQDPQLLLSELGTDKSIMIHEHRYSDDRRLFEQYSGRFNVGFVSFRVGDEARACVDRWRAQVIAECVLDPDRGLCGDQGYLNEWPSLYPGLQVLSHLGGGVAPWNLNSYTVGGSRSAPTVNGVPIVFFHFHAFRTVGIPRFGYALALPAYGYSFSSAAHALIFKEYSRRVRNWHGRLERAGFNLATDLSLGLREAVVGVASGRYVRAAPGRAPRRLNTH